MNFCSNCGAKVEEGAKFCHSCGNAIANDMVANGKVFAKVTPIPNTQGQTPVPNQVAFVSEANYINMGVQKQPTTALQPSEAYCRSCGEIIKKEAEICPKCGVNQNKSIGSEEVFCRSCGEKIKTVAEVCPKCGVRQNSFFVDTNGSKKDWNTVLMLAIFGGGFGIHRFYVGKTGTGILMILTLGGFGIWALIDIIRIAQGKFFDASGNLICKK